MTTQSPPAPALPTPAAAPDGGDRAAPWHGLTGAAALERLDSGTEGLSEAEATARLARHGANSLPHARRPSMAVLFLRQFRSPLIYLLLGATVVSAAVGHVSDAGFILGVLLLNAVIGAIQEGRAGASAAALRKLVRQTARVRRENGTAARDAGVLVPGDIVLLESGDRVPADLRLLQGLRIRANESLLTGEAMPVRKDAEAVLPPDTVPGDRKNMLFAGTTVVEGRGTGVVVATAQRTELGRIDLSLREIPPEPLPLMRHLARLSRQVAIGTVALIAVVAIAYFARGAGIEDILMLAIALAVATIPEGLPIAVTVALAAATRRMAARNVIVRTLPAVEGLGACTLIATDKTGTLTQNQLSVETLLTAQGEQIEAVQWRDPEHRDAVAALGLAVLECNEAALSPQGEPVGDSVDVALMRFAMRTDGVAEPGERLALFAYEPANRFASVAVRDGAGVAVVAKGAVETIAPMCDGVDPHAIQAAEELARAGYRVLAIARRAADGPDEIELSAPTGLTLLGLVGLLDPLRPEAADAILTCRAAGIDVRMLTGDHPATARTIARQLGLAEDGDKVATGQQLTAIANDPDALERRVRATRVFARIEPAQKLQIVQILQRGGQTVAVTGDGVNDAPALQAADIGVAMGRSGTDVARGAADLILTDDNFASIVAGIEEGRAAHANLRRIVIFLLGTAMAEISMFLGAILTGLPMPLTPVQILWANLVTESAQNVGLALAGAEGDELQQPPPARAAPLIDSRALVLMLVPAAVMLVTTIALFGWWLGGGGDLDTGRTLALLTVVLFQNVFVLSISSEHHSILQFRWRRNRWLVAGVGAALGLHLLAMLAPPLRDLLGLTALQPVWMLASLAGAGAVLIASEATKALLRDAKPRPRRA